MSVTKGLVALLALAAVGTGIYVYATGRISPVSQANPTPTSAPAPTRGPGEVATAFYDSYQNCMKNPPAEAKGRVDEYCQSHTGLTTAAFMSNLDQGGTAKAGANPIVCAQNIPESVLTGSVSSNNSTARVTMTETFGPTKLEVPVDLKLEDNQWRVDNIICPRPSPQ